MSEKCFCHLNGYAVKDATARENIDTLSRELTVQTERVNQITSLPEGSTSGDAELLDARVGYDGIVYSCVGEAIRTPISELKNLHKGHRNLYDGVDVYEDETGNKTSFTINNSGEITTDITYTDSVILGFIDVKPNTDYTSFCIIRNLVEYDVDGNFIKINWGVKKVGSVWQFKTSESCRKIKIVSQSTIFTNYNIYNRFLFEGTHSEKPQIINKTFVEALIVENDNISDGVITSEKISQRAIEEQHCDFIVTNKDFLRNVDWVIGSCTSYGVFDETLTTFRRTSFIPVTPGCRYSLTHTIYTTVVGFDRNFQPCNTHPSSSQLTITDDTFITPDNCRYIVLSATPSELTKLSMFFADANQEKKNTFTMPDLKITMGNLDSDVLGSVKPSTTSILADVIFTTETKKIKLIGDSITHGMGSTDYTQSVLENDFLYNVYSNPQYRNYGVKCWAGMLKTYLENKFNCSVVNNGASGSKVEHLVNNWETIVSPDDDVIICMIGTNDRATTLSTLYNGVLSLYNKATANNQKIIFVSPPPSSIDNEVGFNIHIDDVSNLYNYVNESLSVGYIPLYNEFVKYCKTKNISIDSLLQDGLHPNDDGYKLMFEIIVEHLGFAVKRDGATW